MQCGDSTYYTYGTVQVGTETHIILDESVDKHPSRAKWVLIGSIHTHPNDNAFSDEDRRAIVQEEREFITYVVFSGGADKFIIWSVPGGLVYPNPVAGASIGPVTSYNCLR